MSRTPEDTVVRTPGAPGAIGPYSQGRKGSLSGRWVVTSGQIGLDPATAKLVAGGVAAETERALQNLEAILTSAAAALGDVVKTTVYLADMADFQAMNEVYARYFPDTKPARTTVAARGLPLDARVEIEAWALLP